MSALGTAHLVEQLVRGAEQALLHSRTEPHRVEGINVLPVVGSSAAVRFLVAEGCLIRQPEFQQFVSFDGDAARIDFSALAIWADQPGSRQANGYGVLARIACTLAGCVPTHAAGSDDAENWTLACLFYDLAEQDGACSTAGAVISSVVELALGRRWVA